jgi:membrane fusion protein, multidrug efflux system
MSMSIANPGFFAYFARLGLLFSALWALAGCAPEPEPPRPSAPQVAVAPVIHKSVPVYLDFVGNLRATQEVEVRARVKGYLIKRDFRDGADVKEGDLLFVIDPREYQADLERAQAQVARDQASLAFARSQVRRYEPLTAKDLTPEDTLENYQTIAREKAAAVKGGEAAVQLARLNLSYCTIRAPLSGRIGRRLVDVGNLVGAGEDTLLATIVQMDPIYVFFSPGERHLPQIMQHHREGKLKVQIRLADGSVHPQPGKLDFIDNRVDPATATIAMRAVVPNPDRRLVPGQYVSVRLRLTEREALLAPERALGTDQIGSHYFVVGPDNLVEQRYVRTGARHDDNLIVIEEGLEAGEQVVVEGIQRVRPGMAVEPRPAAGNRNAAPDQE